MKTNKFKSISILIIAILLTACSSGGKEIDGLSLDDCNEVEEKIEWIPFDTEKEEDETLTEDETKVILKGVEGSKIITYCDGEVFDEKIDLEPITEIILVGKKELITEEVKDDSTSNKGNGNSTVDKGKDKDKGNGSTNGGNTKPENKPENKPETKPEEKPKPPVDNGNTKPPVKPPVDNGGGNTKPPVKPPVKTQKDVTTTEAVGFQTTYVDNPNLDKGTERVKTNGVNGTRTIVTRIYYTDGKETSRSQVSNSITTQPVNKVIERGTKVKPVGPPKPTKPLANSGMMFDTMEEATAFGNSVVGSTDYEFSMYWKNKLGFSATGFGSLIVGMTDGSIRYTVEFY